MLVLGSLFSKVRVLFFLVGLTIIFPVMADQGVAKQIIPIISLLLQDDAEEIPAPASLQHKTILNGPVAGAQIEAKHLAQGGGLEVLETTIGQISDTQLLENGAFSFQQFDLETDEWVLVSASGGNDVDYDKDNIFDDSPTVFGGSIHALASAEDWNNKGLTVSPLTEIVWRYAQNIIPLISLDGLSLRLNDIARALLTTDINGDELVDYSDILQFDAHNLEHMSKLSFDLAALSLANDDGISIISALQSGRFSDQLSRMQEVFGHLLVFNPVPDSRYKSVAIGISLLGSGTVSSDSNPVLAVSSASGPLIYEDVEYFIKGASETITFTATPDSASNIANWKGCDVIENNLTQCTINKSQSRNVMAIFEQKEVDLKGTFHDLTMLDLVVSENSISFVIPASNNGLIDQLANALVGDFIAGDEGDGFLREITVINQISNTEYELSTINANLEDVISNGTARLETALTNGDLVDDTSQQLAFTPATGMQAVRLVKSPNAGDTKFKIMLGKADNAAIGALNDDVKTQNSGVSETISQTVTLYEEPACEVTPDDCGKITAKGELSLELDLDVAADYSLASGMRYFEFSVNTKASDSFEITATKPIAKIDRQRKLLGTLQFTKIAFAIGPVPVWVTPRVDIYAYYEGEIKAEAVFKIGYEFSLRGGVRYTKSAPSAGQPAWGIIKAGSIDPIFEVPTTTIEVEAKGGIEVFTGLKLYDITGPKIKADGGLKLDASAPVNLTIDGALCYSGIDIAFSAFADVGFNWDLSSNTKFGRFLHLREIEENTRFTIYRNDWPLYDWSLFGNCPSDERSFLVVGGEGIIATVDQGDTTLLTSTVELGNDGSQELNWEIFDVPDYMQVSGISGSIPVGDTKTNITMTIDPSSLPTGIHRATMLFKNMDPAAPLLERSKLGDTEKTIEITVLPLNASANAPTLTEFSSVTGGIGLSWAHSPAISEPAYTGYRILYSVDPTDLDAWQIYQTTSINSSSLVVNSFPLEQVGFVAVQAFNLSSEGAISNSIQIGQVQTTQVMQLNDTGITFSGNHPSGNNTTCTGDTIRQQDCSHGRDSTNSDDSDGDAGFSFVKIGADGTELSAASSSWSCVKDNITGLIWEKKTNDGTQHDKDNTYQWGGLTAIGLGHANLEGTYYDSWDSLVIHANSNNFCGYSDWRVPTIQELGSITNLGVFAPAIDTNYFPNTQYGIAYWSSSPYAKDSDRAWSTAAGREYLRLRSNIAHVRLVR